MSDDTQRVATADLKLVLHNTEKSKNPLGTRRLRLEATERLVAGVGPRFNAIEARLIGRAQGRSVMTDATVEYVLRIRLDRAVSAE
jgi:hypothetical protein